MDMIAWMEDNRLYIKLSGEIDHHSIKEIREKIDNTIFLQKPKELYLNLEAIDFMDSSGLGLILGRLRLIKEYSGTLNVQNPTPRVEKMLRMAGVDKLPGIIFSSTDNSATKGTNAQ